MDAGFDKKALGKTWTKTAGGKKSGAKKSAKDLTRDSNGVASKAGKQAGLYHVPRKHEIFNRGKVVAFFSGLKKEGGLPDAILRSRLLDHFKGVLAAGSEAIRHRFAEGADGLETVHAQTFLMDQIICVILEFTENNLFPLEPSAADRSFRARMP